MAWIKRNLFFVLSLAAGVIAAGFCGYLLSGDLSANSAINDDYASHIQEYNSLIAAPIQPTADNIKKVKEEQDEAVGIQSEFRNFLVPFPPVPNINTDQAFHSYLLDRISELSAAATSAGVGTPSGFGFAFSEQSKTLNYTNSDIHPMLQQLTEVRAICDVLFAAKINYLVSLQRAHVAESDGGASTALDYLAASITTNDSKTEIISPYKIAFRGFTRELAAVMEGLARSTNCFVVQVVLIQPAPEGAESGIAPPPSTPAAVAAAPSGMSAAPPPPASDDGADFAASYGIAAQPGRRRNPNPYQQQPVAAPRPAILNSGPAPALSERLLDITIALNVVKMRGGGH